MLCPTKQAASRPAIESDGFADEVDETIEAFNAFFSLLPLDSDKEEPKEGKKKKKKRERERDLGLAADITLTLTTETEDANRPEQLGSTNVHFKTVGLNFPLGELDVPWKYGKILDSGLSKQNSKCYIYILW